MNQPKVKKIKGEAGGGWRCSREGFGDAGEAVAAVRRGEVLLDLRLPPQPRAVRVPLRRRVRGGGGVHRRLRGGVVRAVATNGMRRNQGERWKMGVATGDTYRDRRAAVSGFCGFMRWAWAHIATDSFARKRLAGRTGIGPFF